MVFVQHILTQQYLQSFSEWNPDLTQAWDFESPAEAIRYCEMSGLADVQIIVPSDSDVQRFALPARHPAFLTASRQVPVVLPRSDSKPN